MRLKHISTAIFTLVLSLQSARAYVPYEMDDTNNELHEAIRAGNVYDAFNILLESDDSESLVNEPDEEHEYDTPLHCAIRQFGDEIDPTSIDPNYGYADADIFSLLLHHGANLTATNADGVSPVGLAYNLGFLELGDRLADITREQNHVVETPRFSLGVTSQSTL